MPFALKSDRDTTPAKLLGGWRLKLTADARAAKAKNAAERRAEQRLIEKAEVVKKRTAGIFTGALGNAIGPRRQSR